jgi:hypothetical protein
VPGGVALVAATLALAATGSSSSSSTSSPTSTTPDRRRRAAGRRPDAYGRGPKHYRGDELDSHGTKIVVVHIVP